MKNYDQQRITIMAQELFGRVDRQVGNLPADTINGRTALPDLQRSFVPTYSKDSHLLGSTVKGIPIGNVMFGGIFFKYDNQGTGS